MQVSNAGQTHILCFFPSPLPPLKYLSWLPIAESFSPWPIWEAGVTGSGSSSDMMLCSAVRSSSQRIDLDAFRQSCTQAKRHQKSDSTSSIAMPCRAYNFPPSLSHYQLSSCPIIHSSSSRTRKADCNHMGDTRAGRQSIQARQQTALPFFPPAHARSLSLSPSLSLKSFIHTHSARDQPRKAKEDCQSRSASAAVD